VLVAEQPLLKTMGRTPQVDHRADMRCQAVEELTGVKVPLTFSRIENSCFLLRRIRAFCKLPCTQLKAQMVDPKQEFLRLRHT